MEDTQDTQSSYGDFVKYLYEKGFHVYKYSIDLTSNEVICDCNKIAILPISEQDEKTIYVFTGTSQKIKTLSEPTEFKLSLFDINNSEFKDDDNIMLSIIITDKTGENVKNLYTRNYATWKFGVIFDKGILLDSNRYILFQAQKNIGRFDIDIRNIDLFKHKNKANIKNDKMTWID